MTGHEVVYGAEWEDEEMLVVGDAGPIHVVLNHCDRCRVFCDADHYGERTTHHPRLATCKECLRLVAEWGIQARAKLDEMGDE